MDIAYTVLDLIQNCFVPNQTEFAFTPDGNTYEQLCAAAESLGISALTAFSLKKKGIVTPELQVTLARAQRRALLLDAEYRKISKALKEAHIRHLPVKGIVIKDLYPSVGLREMSDIDIWFDPSRAESVRSIMTALGYSTEYFGTSKHDVYLKPPMFCVEMHRQLIDGDVLPEGIDYYNDQWEKLNRTRKDKEYVLEQSHEDLYVYVAAHAYKHYLIAGVGIRVLLDFYVMLHEWGSDMDMSYIAKECQKLGIADFENLIRRISEHLFDRQSLNRQDKLRLDEFICSDIHGNMQQYYANAIGKSKNKRSYIISRLKTTDDQLRNHPFLSRHKALRPFYFPVRLTDALFKRRKMLKTELKTLYRYNKNHDKKDPE